MHEDKIRQALIELLYRNSYGVVISNIVISLAAVSVLRHVVSASWLAGWVGALYLLIVIRVFASRRFFRRPRDPRSIMRWAWLAAAFTWVSGLMWGTLGWVGFLPDEPIVLSFTVIVLTGLVCGTVPSLSAFPPALIGSILVTVLPIAARCILTDSDISGAFLFLLASLVAINFYYCRITYRMLRETVSLRLENESLVGHLQEERDRAQAADRAKTRFLAAASHDLRQPIHALSLLVSTLAILGQRGNVSSGDARDLATRAKSAVGNLSGLLNALLDISRLDAGIVTVVNETMALRDLFRDLRDEFAAEAHQRGLELRIVDSDLLVDSDPMMLRRILNNLLSNALRYTKAGSILLGCRRRGNTVEIQVLDTGSGIPADQQAMIFEEFVQLQNPARDRTQGLGLGLAIVRRTAELLQHPLRLVSVPGRGSMFSITVPRAHPVRSILQRGQPSPAADITAGIMLVEDEKDVFDAMVRLLTLEGHRVYAGRSVGEVLKVHTEALMAGDAPVDLIVADYRLEHGTTGLDAIQALSAHIGRRVPAIIVTGDTSPSRLKEVSASSVRILHKPITGEELREVIHTTLRGIEP
ncbi:MULTISPECIES: hybrid sensor histidine kinase/response regulator [unclassified Ensifer]|uniref:hybrid sensor histidine kinase/response regulator n=1 Tax=unclassified Ensifer TaxID=2633371 RepID=UPI00081349F3|nr:MULTISPECIES: hybrid sensor histidine kinase/response regulator [unclassified Ensifer]OCP25083.1 hybrid sensor histidine kinase/response regulator [Ensifer sp. LC54]OCP25254.1 hybrid sensor histidine kinase/response regulator [Ensifer sp. LC384]